MLTESRRLWTGMPVWQSCRTPRLPIADLVEDIATDVLVIGAGISGAMIAEALSGHGLDILVVDRRKPLTGSTSASTALIQYEIDVPLTNLTKMIGMARATAAWRRSRIAVESIAAKIRIHDIDCSAVRKDSLYLSGNVLDRRGLEEEARLREAIGLPTALLDRRTLRHEYGMRANAALLNQNNLTCNPVQLTAGFLKAAIERGATLMAPVVVETLHHKRNQIVVKTGDGPNITTRYVVLATGYERPSGLRPKKHAIASTWALATSPVKGFDIPLFWESSDPYCYGRATADGRMVFGGADEEFDDEDERDRLMDRKRRALERRLAALLPDRAFETTHFWGADFGGSETGLPSIGQVPGHRNCFVAMAYGGNGITFSRIAADIISARLLGKPDPEQGLFAFD